MGATSQIDDDGKWELSTVSTRQKPEKSLQSNDDGEQIFFVSPFLKSTRSSECQRTKEVCRLVYGTNAQETDANLFLSCVNKGHTTPTEEEGRQKNPEANNSKKKMKKYKGPTPEVACELGA